MEKAECRDSAAPTGGSAGDVIEQAGKTLVALRQAVELGDQFGLTGIRVSLAQEMQDARMRCTFRSRRGN